MSILEDVRAACAGIAASSHHVHVDEAAVPDYASSLASLPAPVWDPRLYKGDEASTVAFVLTLSAVNFGSGWFPLLRKTAPASGYFTIAAALGERFRVRGPFTAEELSALDTAECGRLFGQGPEVEELMALYADGLNEIGRLLLAGHGGSFTAFAAAAGGRAARLAQLLAQMSSYEDAPFWKRAQLTASELALALDGRGLGAFSDLECLTAIADNLVPHVLRLDGILRYQPSLLAHIDAGHLLEHGSDEEVEIRACAVHAVELVVAALDGGRTAAEIDNILWARGQQPRYKAALRHRCRTTAY